MKKQIVTVGMIIALAVAVPVQSLASSNVSTPRQGGMTHIERVQVTAAIVVSIGVILRVLAEAAETINTVNAR